MALSQTNIKRLLGYSSISHLGYLLVALIALQSGEMSMIGPQRQRFPTNSRRIAQETNTANS